MGTGPHRELKWEGIQALSAFSSAVWECGAQGTKTRAVSGTWEKADSPYTGLERSESEKQQHAQGRRELWLKPRVWGPRERKAEVLGCCPTGSESRGWRCGQLAFREVTQASNNWSLQGERLGQGASLGFTALAGVVGQRYCSRQVQPRVLAAAGNGVTRTGPDKGFCCVPGWVSRMSLPDLTAGREEGAQGQLSPREVWLPLKEALPRRTLPNVTSLRKQYVIIVIIYFMNYFINVQFLKFK